MKHGSRQETAPGQREWLVPTVIGLAILVVVGGAEYSKRHHGVTAVVEGAGDAEPGAPPANAPANGAPADAPTEIEASHVLVMYRGSMRAPPNVTRTKEEAQARARTVLQRARAGGDFAALAREFSDEPGAGDRGGSLGRFGRGVMVGAFGQAAFSLRAGQVSDLVETPFGYHVIKRSR